MALNLLDGSKFGFVKFTDLDGGISDNHKIIQCSNKPGAKCFTDQIVSGDSSTLLHVGTVLDSGMTMTSHSMFASDGTW